MSEHSGWVLALPLDLAIFLHSEKKKIPWSTFFVPFLGKTFLVHIYVYLCGKLIVRNCISFGSALPKRTIHFRPLAGISRNLFCPKRQPCSGSLGA